MEMNGFSNTFAAGVISALTGLLAVGGVAIGTCADKFGLRVVAPVVSLIFMFTFITIALAPKCPWIIVLFIITYGFGCPSVNVISPLLANHMFGDKAVGPIIGWINIFIALGGCISTTVCGMIFDKTGSFMPVWIILAVSVLIATIIRAIATSKKYTYKPN